MQKADQGKFRQLVQMLGANFRADVTTPLLQAYWVGLNDLPIAVVTVAVRKAMRECEFFPAVAKIRELAKRREIKPLCPEAPAKLEAERARCIASFEGKDSEVRKMLAELPYGWKWTMTRMLPKAAKP